MDEQPFTVIDDGRPMRTTASVSQGRVRLPAAAVGAALGWELKPQGLCKREQCVPVSARADLVTDAGVDLAAFAEVLSRPLAIDLEECVAYLGIAAVERSAQLASLQAPDFKLPDLTGRQHALSDYRGKKVLLVAYASW
jgi:hypothetical protein